MGLIKKIPVYILFLAAFIATVHIFEHTYGNPPDSLDDCPVLSSLAAASLNTLPALPEPQVFPILTVPL
ncbi:MAG TPA: hypothetical protein PLL10_01895, partial [Elusimicrobiales bacterium]|nr:hypothetical protein [Elusimicrobiales bacterium]